MKKTLPIAHALAFVTMVVIDYLSNSGIFNGNNFAE